ncbi:MAG: 4'-phosphopantetheinyl transferase superfamily protein [Clostridium sp.]|jgi:4'-phosphopantetheinyl transferase|nr:4'-phosphopantetheinyl transferase superfamily protein [Clostridium sp.]
MPELFVEKIPASDSKALSARGYALALELAARHTGLPQGSLRFARGEFGKPYFAGIEDFHFSLSHSGEYLALATHDSPVGVDIELLRKPDLLVARRFFTKDEQEYVAEDEKRFFEVWTRKEAYIKYTGMGLRTPLPSFSVFYLPGLRLETQMSGEYCLSLCTKNSADTRNAPAP